MQPRLLQTLIALAISGHVAAAALHADGESGPGTDRESRIENRESQSSIADPRSSAPLARDARPSIFDQFDPRPSTRNPQSSSRDAAGPRFLPVERTGEVRFEPSDREQAVPEHFRLGAHTFPFETDFQRHSGPVRVFRVRFPSPVTTKTRANNTIHARYFQPADEGPYPGVLVLHILGGEFAFTQAIANSLARQGIAAMTVRMPYYGERRAADRWRMITRNPRESVEGMQQAVLDFRRAAAWLAARPEVDADRLGVTGISLGGVMAVLGAAGEPRFRNVAVFVGGGHLGETIWNAPWPEAEEFRRKWRAGGGTRESFIKLLAPVDPASYGHLLKDRRVLLVAARKDELIPRASTLALWESMNKRAELVWLDSGHLSSGWYLYGEIRRITGFFKSRPQR